MMLSSIASRAPRSQVLTSITMYSNIRSYNSRSILDSSSKFNFIRTQQYKPQVRHQKATFSSTPRKMVKDNDTVIEYVNAPITFPIFH